MSERKECDFTLQARGFRLFSCFKTAPWPTLHMTTYSTADGCRWMWIEEIMHRWGKEVAQAKTGCLVGLIALQLWAASAPNRQKIRNTGGEGARTLQQGLRCPISAFSFQMHLRSCSESLPQSLPIQLLNQDVYPKQSALLRVSVEICWFACHAW